MASILFLTPYYPPETGAPQTRISETAVRLVRRGHRVTVLTTLPNYPNGVVPPAYRRGRRRREVVEGASVVRVWSLIRPNRGFLGRVLAQMSFGCLAGVLGAPSVGRPDLIIVESPPLFDAIAGRVLARLKRCPFVFTVADIWPESAVQLGMLRNRTAIWLAERLEWSTYRQAAAVWAITEGIRRTLIERGLDPERVFLLTNGVDTMRFRPGDRAQARRELEWDDAFTVLYAGTIGLAQGLSTLVAAAEALRDHRDVRVVVVGEGAAKAALETEAIRRGLKNIVFLGLLPHDRMPLFVAAADACLVSLRKIPMFNGAVPSKLYEAMAGARPILLAVDGEASRLVVDEAGAGVFVEPEDPAALASAILALKAEPDAARQLGLRGRAWVEAKFDRDELTARLETEVMALLRSGRSSATDAHRAAGQNLDVSP